MKLSEIKQVLAERAIQLTKSLGQNFLHDRNQLRRIADAAQLNKADKVLEVGPGLGPLTELLLERAGEVLAIEKDRRLVEILHERFVAKLTLLHDDALDFLRRELRDWSDWKVVSNLPYSIASPILVEMAQCQHPPKQIVATLQLEVARRLSARQGEADYGLLTLLVGVTYEFLKSFKIPASCFFPEPDVDSACVILRRRPEPLLVPELRPLFDRILKRAFSQRRKMMFKLLKEDWPVDKLEEVFRESRLPLQVRAEALSLEQFAQITEALAA